MVLKEGFLMAALGIGIGVVAAFALMRLISALLFGVQTHDVAVFAIVTGTLFAITLLACYLPARRATKVDPLVALRYE
jgi:putative ABC transport system permease protein